MKRILLSVVLGIAFLGVSRSFAAGEGPGRMVPAVIFAAQLARENNVTPEQQEEVRRMLDAETNRDGELPENVARDIFADWQQEQARAGGQVEEKGEGEQVAQVEMVSGAPEGASGPVVAKPKRKAKPGVQGMFQQVARQKNVPAVLEGKMAGFLPSGYVVPLEWNIKFPRGKSIQRFATIKRPMLDPDDLGALAASVDGRKVALKYKLYQHSSYKRVVWDMQDSFREPQVSDNREWPFAVDNIADEKSPTYYLAYSFDGTKRAKRVSMVNEGPEEVEPSGLARDIWTRIDFEQKKGEEWVFYGESISILPAMSDHEKDSMKMGLSPYGRRLCIFRDGDGPAPEDSSKFAIKVFDVMTGKPIVLEEGLSGYQGAVEPLGFAFSPTGRYVMWAVFDSRDSASDIVIKIADLNQLFGNDEYEMEQAEARAGRINREAKETGFEEGVTEF